MSITYFPDAKQHDSADPLLPYIPARQRGPVKNAFLAPVRAGFRDPHVIRQEALLELQDRLRKQSRYRTPRDTLDLQQAVSAIIAHPTEAIAFAQACIRYEQLPPEEKARRKEIRGEAARDAYMDAQPPTDRQRWKLMTLGVATAPRSKLHASQLIDSRLKGGA